MTDQRDSSGEVWIVGDDLVGGRVKLLLSLNACMSDDDNTDANGFVYRRGGGSPIGESMPGTFGDSERVIHDKDGDTPAVTDDVEVPSDETEKMEEKTETDGLSVDELLKLRE
jgi:hypothetical protein